MKTSTKQKLIKAIDLAVQALELKCGAGAPGSPGFAPNNTCHGGGGKPPAEGGATPMKDVGEPTPDSELKKQRAENIVGRVKQLAELGSSQFYHKHGFAHLVNNKTFTIDKKALHKEIRSVYGKPIERVKESTLHTKTTYKDGDSTFSVEFNKNLEGAVRIFPN